MSGPDLPARLLPLADPASSIDPDLLSRIQADFKVVGPESFKKAYRERLEVLLKRIS
jgi:hypothetical protein